MPNTTIAKDLPYYINLPWTIILKKDEQNDVIARIEELDGCISHGSNESEALDRLNEMRSMWLQDCLESGSVIPEPKANEDSMPSGKWVQRVPRGLHMRLAKMAKREGVSLNQLVTYLLASARP